MSRMRLRRSKITAGDGGGTTSLASNGCLSRRAALGHGVLRRGEPVGEMIDAIAQQKEILRAYCDDHPAATYRNGINVLMNYLTIVFRTPTWLSTPAIR